jgi:hypothetical protein
MPILLYAAMWGAFFGMFSLEQNADDASGRALGSTLACREPGRSAGLSNILLTAVRVIDHG